MHIFSSGIWDYQNLTWQKPTQWCFLLSLLHNSNKSNKYSIMRNFRKMADYRVICRTESTSRHFCKWNKMLGAGHQNWNQILIQPISLCCENKLKNGVLTHRNNSMAYESKNKYIMIHTSQQLRIPHSDLTEDCYTHCEFARNNLRPEQPIKI